MTETSPVEPAQPDVIDGQPSPAGPKQTFVDRLETDLTVPAGGSFAWSINPSTRPAVMEKRFPTVSDTPTRAATYHNQTQTQPNQVVGEGEPGTYEDIALDVRESDAAKLLSLELTGDIPADDYDLELYRRVNGELVDVASSGNPANPELILLDDPPVGEYVLRVVNFLAAGPWTVEAKWLSAGPDEVTPGTVEAWTLTCERPDGVYGRAQGRHRARRERRRCAPAAPSFRVGKGGGGSGRRRLLGRAALGYDGRVLLLVEVVVEGLDRPPVGAPLRLEVRDTSLADVEVPARRRDAGRGRRRGVEPAAERRARDPGCEHRPARPSHRIRARRRRRGRRDERRATTSRPARIRSRPTGRRAEARLQVAVAPI